MKNVSAIITSDWHLRLDTPVCRTDDYVQAQSNKVEFINSLQWKLRVPILNGGDIFNSHRPPLRLLSWALGSLMCSPGMFSIPGNHDLPQHNLDQIESSGFGILQAAGLMQYARDDRTEFEDFVLYYVPWGVKAPTRPRGVGKGKKKKRSVLLVHDMIYVGEPPWPGAENTSSPALQYLRKHQFDLIVSGHNHQTFVEEHEGRKLVNPGSLMRMTVAQVDHRPSVFLWNAETNDVESVPVPTQDGVVDTSHIAEKEDRERKRKEVEAFVASLRDDVELHISFERNLEEYIRANGIIPPVQREIWEAVQTK